MYLRRPIALLVAATLMTVGFGSLDSATAAQHPPTRSTSYPSSTDTHPSLTLAKAKSPVHKTFRKKIFPIRRSKAASKQSRTRPIRYHGGPVMTGQTHLYFIWYGSWEGNSAVNILQDLANSIGGSTYYAINSSYMQMNFSSVSTDVTLAGEVSDAYSHGKRLSDVDVRRIVRAALANDSLPTDEAGIYMVLTSADVVETSGFTTMYCGWHSHARMEKADIKFAFIGDPTTQGLSHCSAQRVGPNGNAGADAMASVFAHELVETVTDPDADAWYDSAGSENADKCAWTYGSKVYQVNGAKANLLLGTRDYLIQQNWNAGKHQGCSMEPLN